MERRRAYRILLQVNLSVQLRGVDYEYGFVILNKEPALEKVLDNIRMITNKSLPFEIVYTTSEDENDAAVNIWEAFQDRVLRQKNNYSK
jgi:hypothetical protein